MSTSSGVSPLETYLLKGGSSFNISRYISVSKSVGGSLGGVIVRCLLAQIVIRDEML